MKTLTLKLGDKLYTSGKITAWHAREAFAINKDMIAFANKGKALESVSEDDLAEIAEIMGDMEALNNRKTNLICEVYGNRFSAERLEKELSSDEINEQVNKIVYGIMGIVEKN